MNIASACRCFAAPRQEDGRKQFVAQAKERLREPPTPTHSYKPPSRPPPNLIPTRYPQLTYVLLGNFSLPSKPASRAAKNPRPKDRAIMFENNYKYRNVYKSIIRRMSTHVHENRKQMTDFLLKAGFTSEDIEHGITKVTCCKDTERKSGSKKMGPRLINEAVKSITVYTYILREALEGMLDDWNDEKLGKVAKKNIETYKKVCKAYYDKVKKLLTD